MTIEQALIAGIGALSTTTAALYTFQLGYLRRLEQKIDACEGDRMKLALRIGQLEGHARDNHQPGRSGA